MTPLLEADEIVFDLDQIRPAFLPATRPCPVERTMRGAGFEATTKPHDDTLRAGRSSTLTDGHVAAKTLRIGERQNRKTFMKLTDALIGEHGAFRALLKEIEGMVSYAGEAAQVESAMAIFRAEVTQHARLEENLLFPAIEPYLDSNDLIAQMRSEHQEIRSGLGSIEDARDLDQALEAVQHTLEAARRHFENEEKILYAFAQKVLDEETLTRLGEDWAAARAIAVG